MLERSLASRFARSVFFEHVNDVDVYIEDTSEGAKKLFSILIGRALGGKLNISTVFPLGDRNSVIDACLSDQSAGGRPRVYIIDGDFSCLGGFSWLRLKRLFSLPRYCVENYLIDDQALLTVLFEEDAVRDVRELEGLLDFPGWVGLNVVTLERLFVGYSIANRTVPHIATVGRPVRLFVSGSDGNVDQAKVEHAVNDLKLSVDAVAGEGYFDSEMDMIIATQDGKSNVARLACISGKDYLLPLLMMRVRSMVSIKSTNASLRVRLAQRCDVADLHPLRVHIA